MGDGCSVRLRIVFGCSRVRGEGSTHRSRQAFPLLCVRPFRWPGGRPALLLGPPGSKGRAPVTASAPGSCGGCPLPGPAAPSPARLSLFGHAAAAVSVPPGPPPAGVSGRRAPRAVTATATPPGCGSSPLLGAGAAADLSSPPPQRLGWLRRRSTRKPTRGASAAPPPWPTAPAACWRAWTSWSSGEAAAGARAGAGAGAAGGGRSAEPAAASELLARGSCSLETVLFRVSADVPLLAGEKTHSV